MPVIRTFFSTPDSVLITGIYCTTVYVSCEGPVFPLDLKGGIVNHFRYTGIHSLSKPICSKSHEIT